MNTLATNGRAAPELVEGVVEQTNPNGIKVTGAWLNISKYRPLDPPVVGSRVRCEIDTRGFIHSLEVLEAAQTGSQSAASRDERITRLAVLRSAVQLAAGRPDVKSTDVLRIAELFEEWVNR
jgi:hypothetical protein